MSTQITTAARRIQRSISTTHETITRYYSIDGDLIDTHETGMMYTDAADAPTGWALQLTGGHYTQRQIQDMLDGYAIWARGDAPEGMDRAEAIGYHLQEVETTRETARSLSI